MSTTQRDVYLCQACGRVVARRQHCSRCKCIYYCSAACQAADWPEHKRACVERQRADVVREEQDRLGAADQLVRALPRHVLREILAAMWLQRARARLLIIGGPGESVRILDSRQAEAALGCADKLARCFPADADTGAWALDAGGGTRRHLCTSVV